MKSSVSFQVPIECGNSIDVAMAQIEQSGACNSAFLPFGSFTGWCAPLPNFDGRHSRRFFIHGFSPSNPLYYLLYR